MKKKYKLLSNKFHALYIGLSSDLLFFFAINTVFLTSVKGLSDQQMSLLNTIAPFMCIVFQYPILLLIKKIGNTMSIRLGCLFALVSAIVYTFASNFVIILISELFYQLSTMLKAMGSVILKNNLALEKKEDDFASIQSVGLSIYSTITAVIAISVGYLYEIDKFLPMYLCIVSSGITFVLSLFIKDCANTIREESKKQKFTFKIFTPLIVCTFISSMIFVSTLGSIQSNSDLLRKNILEANLGDVKAVKIISFVVFGARIIRILSCFIYEKLNKKIGNNIVPIMYVMLFTAISLITIGGLLPKNYIVQVAMISVGYAIMLACRDPYNIFEEQTLLNNVPPEYTQQILPYMSFCRKIFTLCLGAVMTALLGICELKIAILFLYFMVLAGVIFAIFYFPLLKKTNNAITE